MLIEKSINGNKSVRFLIKKTSKSDGNAGAKDIVLGRTVSSKVGNAAVTYTYDMLNNVVKEVGANTKTYEYDSKGNVLKTTETTGSGTITTTATYDSLGNMLTSTDGKGNTTEYTYDGLNWLSCVRVPFDNTEKSVKYYIYDNIGNLTSERMYDIAGVNRELTYEYDHRGRVVKATNGFEVTYYSYDNAGNMSEMTRDNYRGEDQTTKYEYDRLNRLVKYTDGMGVSETYVYDDYGNMVSKKDRNGKNTTYTYDALGRVLSESVEGVTNTFAYNSTGNVKSSSKGNVTQSYKYNNLGLVSEEYTSTAGGHTIVRTYDNRGRNTQNVYKKGNSVYKTQKYSYDSMGRMKSISSENDNSVKFNGSYTYDNNSNITKVVKNNCTTTYEYNNANLLTEVNNDGTGSNDTIFTYEYNIDGNVKSVTDINGNKTSYSYDAENGLTREYVNTGGNVTEYRYEYDDLGNRIGMKYIENENEVYNIEYAYDRNSRLLSEKKTEPVNSGMFNVTEYGYDNNGNMLSKVWYEQNTENDYELHINDVSIDDSVGYEIYTYDGLNELTGFYDSRGNESSYTYLPNHYRMSKTANGMTTYHIWDGENIVAESDGSKIIRSYVRGHQLLTDDERRTYMYDGHGNMVQQVN